LHVEFRGQHCRHDDPRFPGAWTPNIDTLALLQAILSVHDAEPVLRGRCLEVGCGNGFVAQVLASAAPAVEEMHLMDVNPVSIASASDRLPSARGFRFHTGAAQQLMPTLGHFDLVVCNPPYVPHTSRLDTNEYEGVELIEHMVGLRKSWLRPGGSLVLLVSSVSMPRLRHLGLDESTCVYSRRVPFKVHAVVNDPEWLRELLEEGEGIERDADPATSGYEYWQTLHVHRLGC
jgi:methylase of polypeptide subunit release factors